MSLSFWQLTGENKDIKDNFEPKQKFNFTVKFTFRDMAVKHNGANDMESIEFGVRQSTRPQSIISHTEANFYNYRTKVPTKMDYGTISISFYDDINNTAHDIFSKYVEAISPISRVSKDGADNLMNDGNNASIGPLSNPYGFIKSIEVTHYSLKQNTIYQYLNPKLSNVALDELDMTASEAPIITLVFNCDSIHIIQKDK